MNGNETANSDYLTRCQNALRQKYGEYVYILITQKGDPETYPNGAWFDEYLNKALKVTGVDEDNNPALYILAGGDRVPFSCAELLTWVPQVFRTEELVLLVEEMYCTKRLPSQQEVLALLRLSFPELPDNVELIISQVDPFIFADGTLLWLKEHRHQVGDYKVLFTVGVCEVKAGKFCVVALENSKGSCITLLKAPR